MYTKVLAILIPSLAIKTLFFFLGLQDAAALCSLRLLLLLMKIKHSYVFVFLTKPIESLALTQLVKSL